MRFIDVFGGIGGFSLGLERCNHEKGTSTSHKGRNGSDIKSKQGQGEGIYPPFECVGYYEWDKYACRVYNKNFGTSYEPTDITKVAGKGIPDFDILCGGFPCQPFSIAGKRKGFRDIRGTLFAEIVRIAKEKRPGLLFLENVKGLLNHDGGETFGTILHSLHELGYSLEWEVLNSKNFGVPQNRERVFIIGHLGGGCGREVFPLGTVGQESDGERYTVSGEVSAEKSIASTLTARYHKMGRTDTYIQQINVPKHSSKRIYGVGGCSPTLRATRVGSGGNTPKILSHHPRTNNPKLGGSGPLYSDEHCFALDSHPHKVVGERVRRLTPVECERLQGFPDNWTAGFSDTQRYKMLGNAVTVNVIEAIGRRLRCS